MKIAYISCHDYGKYSVGYTDEETMLLDFLLKKGLDIERQVWSDAGVDWAQYDVAILKTPWDYHEQIEAFQAWLSNLQASNIRMLNPIETIRWNSDKHYLRDISGSGMNVIPTLFLEKGTRPALLPYFEELHAEKIIIKPCVSAGAKNIVVLDKANINDKQAAINQMLLCESYMAQPFMEEIFEGEWSYLFFNGRYSHCILNVPGSGDFRVQHYHGGSTKTADARQIHIKSAAAYVAQFASDSLYARVDGIIRNGQFCLMELELIEPYLYLDTNPDAYENYYNAFMELTHKSLQTVPDIRSKDVVV